MFSSQLTIKEIKLDCSPLASPIRASLMFASEGWSQPRYGISLKRTGQGKGRRFCENRQNRYRDDTRQTKNCQNRIVMIPS
jgi:hypothetical protein